MKACKIIVPLFLLHCCISALFAGSPIELPGLKEPLFSSGEILPSPHQSILFVHHENSYKNAESRQTTAWVLIGIGAGSLTTGTIMLSKGLNNMLNQPSSGDNSILGRAAQGHDVVLISAGGALAFTGLVLTPTGLIMGTAGKIRYNKYTPPFPYIITPGYDSNGIDLIAYF